MNGEVNPGFPQRQASFWSRHQKMVIRLIIVAVIIVGAILYARSQQPSARKAEKPQITQEGGVGGITVTDKAGETPGVKVGAAETEKTIRTAEGKITVAAQKGNGITHLARRALAEYLKNTGSQNLAAEHKIFIEDYLQKKTTQKQRLFVGSEVDFSQADIQQAIDESLKLSDRQLQNLHQYTLRVPNL